jgi:hypothetical protein
MWSKAACRRSAKVGGRFAAGRCRVHHQRIEAERVVGLAAQVAEVALLQQRTGLDGQRECLGNGLGGAPGARQVAADHGADGADAAALRQSPPDGTGLRHAALAESGVAATAASPARR